MSRPYRCLALLLLIALAVAPACQQAEKAPPAVPEYSIQDFLGSVTYLRASFSPDNSKILVSSDASGIYNLYAIPVSGGEPEPLTQSTTESFFSEGYFPADERILYSADQGGNELDHVYVRETDGTVTDLTPGDKLKATFLDWSDDGSHFYIETNERDPKFFDVYEYAADGYGRELIFQNDQAFQLAAISPDRMALALEKIRTEADSDIYLFDRHTGKLENITPHEGDVNHIAETFSPDGKSLLLRTDADREYLGLARQDLATGQREMIATPDWDVLFARYSLTGKYLVVGINNDARTQLLVTGADGSPVALPEVPDAEISSVVFSRDESHMAFYASSSRIPSDLFVQALDGSAPRKLTRSLSAAIDPDDLVEGKVVRFASWDGLEVPGILYTPLQATSEHPGPALVSVHGGPGGQSRLGYSALTQFLVNHGYTIFAINNRGSSGYGKTFFHMDDQKHGNEDLDDCVASKQMLFETGVVDPDRIGILGGSYGGYMVLAALTFRPEEFAVGVDLFGISNWQRTLQSIPPWWESFREALQQEMGPFDDEEFFKAKSPLFHAEKIVRPLMVLQGANDPRVLKVESDEIVAAVRANGVPVDYIVFEDEGHGFVKKNNREEGYTRILAFLDQHLKSRPN